MAEESQTFYVLFFTVVVCFSFCCSLVVWIQITPLVSGPSCPWIHSNFVLKCFCLSSLTKIYISFCQACCWNSGFNHVPALLRVLDLLPPGPTGPRGSSSDWSPRTWRAEGSHGPNFQVLPPLTKSLLSATDQADWLHGSKRFWQQPSSWRDSPVTSAYLLVGF